MGIKRGQQLFLVVIVIFKTGLDEHGQYIPNNFVVTGWANYIYSQR